MIGLNFVFCEQKYLEIWIRSRNSLCYNFNCIYEVQKLKFSNVIWCVHIKMY